MEFLALFLYLFLVGCVVMVSARRVRSSSDFIIGGRSLNFWLTAMSAHASDMSSWLFMAYPAVIYAGGLFNGWVAIGLTLCMLANWTLLAPRLRLETGRWNCATFSSYLQQRYRDKAGTLPLLATLFCFLFYVVYLCAGLVALGMLCESLFAL